MPGNVENRQLIDLCPGEVYLSAFRYRNTGCGLVDEVRRPLLAARGDEQHECAGCGGCSFDFEMQTVLDEPELRLSNVGLAPGKVVYAYLSGRRVTILPLGEGCR